MDHLEALQQFVLDSGAFRAGVVDVDGIPFEPEFRKLCEANSCGMYGRSWMCPPDIGPVDRLINRVKQFRQALVFQTADALEDSYDFEGMMAAGARMNQLIASLRRKLKELGLESCLLLGAGAAGSVSTAPRSTASPAGTRRRPSPAWRPTASTSPSWPPWPA